MQLVSRAAAFGGTSLFLVGLLIRRACGNRWTSRTSGE